MSIPFSQFRAALRKIGKTLCEPGFSRIRRVIAPRINVQISVPAVRPVGRYGPSRDETVAGPSEMLRGPISSGAGITQNPRGLRRGNQLEAGSQARVFECVMLKKIQFAES